MSSKKLAQVFHFDLYGKREDKYNFLTENAISTINWTELNPQAPEHFFVPKDFGVKSEYDKGFSVNTLFQLNGSGIVSKRDSLAFQNSKSEMIEKISDIFNLSYEEIKKKFKEVSWESRDGKVEFVKENILKFGLSDELFVRYNYRLFDEKWTYYTGVSKGFIGWPVKQIMQHLLKDNLSLICSRQSSSEWKHIFISKLIGDFNITGNAGTNGSGYYFPLYLYPDSKNKDLFATSPSPSEGGELVRVPNLNPEIVKQIADKLGLTFVPEAPSPLERAGGEVFAPLDILDYIYAVLHSPNYREKYKEFLKIDFPRVPYPKAPSPSERAGGEVFWQLVKLGGELRQIHLLESPVVEQYITQYPEDGDNEVTKPRFAPSPLGRAGVGSVYINDTQYFANVPQVAWEFYIGGYQPAQKWLKDRKNRKLEFEDILHYQKIIVALSETDRIMREIDKIEIV